MPRIVDHEERRAEVAAAVWRIVSRDGLEAATVRRVAAETGMSTSVVSHYFAGKDDLLRLAFRIVVDRGRDRAIADSADGGRTRALLVTASPSTPSGARRRGSGSRSSDSPSAARTSRATSAAPTRRGAARSPPRCGRRASRRAATPRPRPPA